MLNQPSSSSEDENLSEKSDKILVNVEEQEKILALDHTDFNLEICLKMHDAKAIKEI
jgi:hypothetical protein